jgi:hypothetical protein
MQYFYFYFEFYFFFFEILTYVTTNSILIGCYNAARKGGAKNKSGENLINYSFSFSFCWRIELR